jgi:hypothetical protein
MRERIHYDSATTYNPNDSNGFRELKEDLRKLLSWQLSYDPFHLQVKKGSQNLRGVQAGSLNDVINMHWLVCGEQLVDLLLAGVQACRSKEIPLLRFRRLRPN